MKSRNLVCALPALLLLAACGDDPSLGFGEDGSGSSLTEQIQAAGDGQSASSDSATSLFDDSAATGAGDAALDDALLPADTESDATETSSALLGAEASAAEPDPAGPEEPAGGTDDGTPTGTESGNPIGTMPTSTDDASANEGGTDETPTSDQGMSTDTTVGDTTNTPGATAGGVTDGTAPDPVVCATSEDCADGEYCMTPDGSCDAAGTCALLGDGCIDLYEPVCGCDGNTYGNSCEAGVAGVGVLSAGECTDSTGEEGSCSVEGETYPDGASDIPAPDGCNTCSCSAGLLACTERACVEPGEICGGFAGFTCEEDQYCAYEPGQYCGAADASATCQTRPENCTADYVPVCGCDGKTYSNACSAAAAGTGVLDAGECTPSR